MDWEGRIIWETFGMGVETVGEKKRGGRSVISFRRGGAVLGINSCVYRYNKI